MLIVKHVDCKIEIVLVRITHLPGRRVRPECGCQPPCSRYTEAAQHTQPPPSVSEYFKYLISIIKIYHNYQHKILISVEKTTYFFFFF